MQNYLVKLIQEIQEDELAIEKKRELFDAAWQQFLAEGKPPSPERPPAAPLPAETCSTDARPPTND